jgi:hypothetical protein
VIRAVFVSLLALPTIASALDLSPIPTEDAQPIAAALADLTAKNDKFPVKATADLDNIKGLVSENQEHGLIIIPLKGLKEDRENPALASEKGMPIGVIYFSNILPGELKDKKKLFETTIPDEQRGGMREVRYALLTVKKVSDEEFQLQVWGVDKEPVAAGPLSEEQGDEKGPIDLDLNGDDLEIKLLGKFPTFLPVKVVNY